MSGESMKEELNYLLELCGYDKNAYNLRKANKDLPIRINELKTEIQTAEAKLNEISNLVSETEKKIKDSREFTESEIQNLEDSEERLKNISTNKEYDAVHSEIATHKRNIEDSQASAIHFEQVLENLKEDKKAIEEEYNSIIEKNKPELESLSKDLDSLEDRIAIEVSKSEEPRKKVGKRLISVYERMKKRRKSPYIISIINWNSNVCENCNRTQPAQKVNEVSRMDSIITCEGCGSILIWNESEVPAQ